MKIWKAVSMLSIGVMLATSAVQAAEQTLYQRLGEDTGIHYLVQTAIGKIASDARINKRFAHSNLTHLTDSVTAYMVWKTGGPNRYHGGSLKEIHSGMHISTAEYNAFIQDVQWAENKVVVGKPEQKELNAKLLQAEPAIVDNTPVPGATKKPAAKPTPKKPAHH